MHGGGINSLTTNMVVEVKVMGFFRRYELSDYTVAECKDEMSQLEYDVSGADKTQTIRRIMDQWACFRELLARHEEKNKSKLDK